MDSLVFIVAESALLTWNLADRTSDPEEEEETELVQEVIVHLANAVYLLSCSQQSEVTKADARHNVEQFAEKMMLSKSFGKSEAVHKFHMFQHFPDFVEAHGPAFLWDSFNLEKFLGLVGNGITARVEQGAQVVTNFLLRFHCKELTGTVSHGPEFDEYLKTSGLRRTFYLEKKCITLKYETCELDEENRRIFDEFLCGRNTGALKSVSRVKVRNLILTSSKFTHRGKVNDSYVQLNEKYFGRIDEMCEAFVSGNIEYLISLSLYKKEVLLKETGEVYRFPVNQFPVSPSNERKVFAITKSLSIQKILVSSPFIFNASDFDFFSIWPNEYFPS